MSGARRELLSVGAFFIILVVAIILYATGAIGLALVVPVVLVLLGTWMLALAAIRWLSPQKYERDVFSTLGIGLLLIAVGGAWYLAMAINWLYAAALVLLAIAVLAIVAALKRK